MIQVCVSVGLCRGARVIKFSRGNKSSYAVRLLTRIIQTWYRKTHYEGIRIELKINTNIVSVDMYITVAEYFCSVHFTCSSPAEGCSVHFTCSSPAWCCHGTVDVKISISSKHIKDFSSVSRLYDMINSCRKVKWLLFFTWCLQQIL